MGQYSQAELGDAKGAIQSSIRKIEKVLETLLKKDPVPKAQMTLANRNIRALCLALALIERELKKSAGNGWLIWLLSRR